MAASLKRQARLDRNSESGLPYASTCLHKSESSLSELSPIICPAQYMYAKNKFPALQETQTRSLICRYLPFGNVHTSLVISLYHDLLLLYVKFRLLITVSEQGCQMIEKQIVSTTLRLAKW